MSNQSLLADLETSLNLIQSSGESAYSKAGKLKELHQRAFQAEFQGQLDKDGHVLVKMIHQAYLEAQGPEAQLKDQERRTDQLRKAVEEAQAALDKTRAALDASLAREEALKAQIQADAKAKLEAEKQAAEKQAEAEKHLAALAALGFKVSLAPQ